jgi:iron complex outermembrane recepter protein
VNGNLYTSTVSAITRGSDNTISAYAEGQIPLLRHLRLDVSGRWNHYRSYGTGWTYRLGGIYTPARWLTLRATYGTSFRAPSLKEQFQGATSGAVPGTLDPCNGYSASSTPALQRNCAAMGLPVDYLQTSAVRINTLGGAASGLQAETSRNLTLGAALQGGPLRFSLDFYRIAIDNAVDRAGAAYILNHCYNDANFGTQQATYCRLVSRNATTGALTVNDSYINIARQKVSGFDFALRYATRIGKAALSLDAQATRYTAQTYQQFPDQTPTEFNGTLRNPKWTGQMSARLAVGGATLMYRASYVQGQSSEKLLGVADGKYNLTTPDYVLHNASVHLRAAKFDIVLGADNLFDKAPPAISSGFYSRVGNAPLYSGYDFYGRSFYTSITARF